MITYADVDFLFTNQAPRDDSVVAAFENIRIPAKEFAYRILDTCPDCPEKERAIWKLREAVMFAVAAIALNQDQIEEPS